MNLKDKNQNAIIEKNLVLAPGASDISEGAVYLNKEHAPACKNVAGKSLSRENPGIEDTTDAKKLTGEGFWSVAPGCSDISEGMVWVTVTQKSKHEGITVFDREEITTLKFCAMV